MYHFSRILHLKEYGYSFPSHMIIGLVTYCDQFCKSCYAGGYRFDPNIQFTASLDVLKNVLSTAVKFGSQHNNKHDYYSDNTLGLKAITLVGSGEPLLYPYLTEFVEFAHNELGLEIGLYTNGNNLRDGVIRPNIDNVPQDFAKLILDNFRFVRISLDAASPTTHFKERGVKNQFDGIVDNIRQLVGRKGRKGDNCPSVGIQFTVDDDNVHEIEDIAKLAKDIGVDYLAYKPKYVPWHLRKDRMTDMKFKNVEKQLLKGLSYADDGFDVHGKFDQFELAWNADHYNTGEYYKVCRNVYLSAYLDIDVDSINKTKSDMRVFICANKDKDEKDNKDLKLWSAGPITANTNFDEFWIAEMQKLVKRVNILNCIAGCKNDPFNQILEKIFKKDQEELQKLTKSCSVAPDELHVNYI